LGEGVDKVLAAIIAGGVTTTMTPAFGNTSSRARQQAMFAIMLRTVNRPDTLNVIESRRSATEVP
jgi:hypothetical protein